MPASIEPPINDDTEAHEQVPEITCHKEGDRWYISFTRYVAAKGWQTFTELSAYTDELLQWIARRRTRFTLMLHTRPFEGAKILELDELCTGPNGGAYYRLLPATNPHSRRIWVCDTSLLVFGDLPYRIFFKKGVST